MELLWALIFITVIGLCDPFMVFCRLLTPVPKSECYSRYREFCRRLINARKVIISTCEHISYLRSKCPYVYGIVCLILVATTEIITYHFDGILIAYILTIVALITPGIRHTGFLRVSCYVFRPRMLVLHIY